MGKPRNRARVRRNRFASWFGVVFVFIFSGCAQPNIAPETPDVLPTATAGDRISLGLRTADGVWTEVGAFTDQPTLIFAFATFDAVSQAAAQPLVFVTQRHPELNVIAIAAQPYSSGIVEAWKAALQPPFIVAYDPTHSVEEGRSALGRIESVPMYFLLNNQARLLAVRVGFQSEEELETLLSEFRIH
ncbi:MAG: hypothetical protein R3A47_12240 [Polyangiales bacterium]